MGILRNHVNVQQAPAYAQEIMIHNAPTADQARLLHDLEVEAEKRIITRGRLDNKLINAQLTVFEKVHNQCLQVCVAFSLNSQEIDFEFEVSSLDQENEIATHIRDRFVQELTNQVLRRI